jgi:hypothetical protein
MVGWAEPTERFLRLRLFPPFPFPVAKWYDKTRLDSQSPTKGVGYATG